MSLDDSYEDPTWLNSSESYLEDSTLSTSESNLEDSTVVYSDEDAGNDQSLGSFVKMELTRGYFSENVKEKYCLKLYSFMKVPSQLETFIRYGLLHCVDSFLFLYTFLPLRVALALWALVTRPFSGRKILTSAKICDALKLTILILGIKMMWAIDVNALYHIIKSQSLTKLYMFYNMLEIADRFLSTFGQDTIDALFWSATELRGWKLFKVVLDFVIAVAYVCILFKHSFTFTLPTYAPYNPLVLHSFLLLCQSTALNVAFNSSDHTLLTLVMSINFIELKGSVFKKFDKNGLFKMCCIDVRERFHLFVLLSLIVLQTIREYSWNSEQLWALCPYCIVMLIAEMVIDWLKHAFASRFNKLPADIYKDYTVILAEDIMTSPNDNTLSYRSDRVVRRMSFVPLPLAVLVLRIVGGLFKINDAPSFIIAALGYICVICFKVLCSVLILGKAYDYIKKF